MLLESINNIHKEKQICNEICENRILASDYCLYNQLKENDGIWTQNQLVRQRTLNNLAKLAKLFSCVVSAYLNGTFDCMLLSCHVRVLESIYTLELPECQRTPCLKKMKYRKLKWPQRDSNPQILSL